MGFDNLERSIKKKLSLQDYNTEKLYEEKTVKQQKAKITVYLKNEAIAKFNEICSKKVLENGKPDKSELISKAIDLLYAQFKE